MKWLKRLFRQLTPPPANGRSAKQENNEVERESRLKAFTSLLTPDDFARVGVTGTNTPRVNWEGLDSVYMVYAGKSGATGGVELDVFVCEGDDDAEGVFETVNAESQGEALGDIYESDLGGVQAVLVTAGEVAGLNVLKGALVFCLAIPNSPSAAKQLSKLASIVLDRFENLKL